MFRTPVNIFYELRVFTRNIKLISNATFKKCSYSQSVRHSLARRLNKTMELSWLIIFKNDTIHFGRVTCLLLALDLVTPPVGICLLVTSGIEEVLIQRVFISSIHFVMAILIVLLIVTFLP